jgi:cyclase
MINFRIIPTLLLSKNRVVKTKRFKDPNYIGDPTNIAKIFNNKEVDELIVLDINASRFGEEPNYEMIENIAGECFMPLTYGGGIRNINQAKTLFSLGIEKISIQNSALINPAFITELSNKFGNQSIVVSVNIKKDWMKRPKIYNYLKQKFKKEDWIDIIKEYEKMGAGEILLNVVDNDGMMNGPDLDILDKIVNKVKIPLIYCGGISSLLDIKNIYQKGASAVAVGSYFIYYGKHNAVLITYPKKSELKDLNLI